MSARLEITTPSNGARRTPDSEFLRAGVEGGRVHVQFPSCASRVLDLPVAGFVHLQDVGALVVLEAGDALRGPGGRWDVARGGQERLHV